MTKKCDFVTYLQKITISKFMFTSLFQKGLSTEEVTKRDVTIQELGHKVTSLQNELKSAQLKILELESVKVH